MRVMAEALLFILVVTDFAVLGTSRLSASIRALAVQGAVLGVLPLVLHPEWNLHLLGLAAGTLLVKAIILPRLLHRAIRDASVRREMEPRISYMGSVLLGAAMLAGALALSSRLPQLAEESSLIVPVALAMVATGLLVITARTKALTQVVGFVMLENGIFLFGITQAERVPFLVDLGVLLDVFVGVFIMGIVVFHINREFDSLSSAHLSQLRD